MVAWKPGGPMSSGRRLERGTKEPPIDDGAEATETPEVGVQVESSGLT